jgi:hypothetical protein
VHASATVSVFASHVSEPPHVPGTVEQPPDGEHAAAQQCPAAVPAVHVVSDGVHEQVGHPPRMSQ